MTDSSSEPNARPRLIDLPASEITRQVADPSFNSGGGVIAALTLGGAAASAELVLKLAARRKSLATQHPEVEALLKKVENHRVFFEMALDRDVSAFTDLVETQREAKRLRATDPEQADALLQDAYVRAAEVPLELGRQALIFMAEVEHGLAFASKFTVSDLGAAAVLARGAIDAALLTVNANLAYVGDERSAALHVELEKIQTSAAEIAEQVMTLTTNVITNRGNGG